jgi:ribosomal protein S18 acetylase RimI-like enzyme
MRAKFPRRSFRFAACTIAGALLFAAAAPVLAARPSAMKLFPEETLLLVRTPNAGELFERLRETSTGRMVRDPQIAPFVERLYGSAGDLYTQKVAEWLGVSWEELQNLPRAEVAFAIVARRDHLPAFVLLVDQGETPSVAKTLLDKALERMKEDGGETTTETIAGQEVTVVRAGDNQEHTVGLFEKEHTIVAATDPGLIREILGHWDSESNPSATDATVTSASETAAAPAAEESSDAEPRQYSGRTLAENNKFVTILRYCRREHDPPPNMILFVDPIGLIRQFNRENAGMSVAMATFPALGIDGLSAIGATMTFSVGRFDSLSHMHVLLDNPRAGVVQVIAFEPGDLAPPEWVFADVENYITWRWNVQTSFNVIRSLIDRFQFDGRTDKFVAESINEKFGIDFEKEIIDNIEGQVTWVGGYEKPAHFRGQQTTIGIKVVDEELAKQTLEKFVAKYPERLEKREFGGVTYYAVVIDWPEQLREEPPNTPLFAVTDGYFFAGGSCQLFERAMAARDGTVERLADQPQFAQLAAEVQQEAPGITPAMFLYSRFEETLRQWYDLLTNEKTQQYLSEHAEGNPFFAALADSVAANELPPFDAIARYALPSVGMIYDTDSGFHAIGFAIRDEEEAAP